MNRRNYRSGFSLIELLIVVAIIAALIGVAVPYFQSNLSEAQVTKAKQDLDTIRNAINLYESRYRALVGQDMKQILGQTMQDIPKDPWGAEYFLDANLGIIWTYGADGQPGGQAGDADQVFQYKPKLQIRKVEYEGPYGRPVANNKMTLHFTKPFDAGADPSTLSLAEILLVRDITSTDKAKSTRLALNGAGLGTWAVQPKGPGGSDPDNGFLILKCTADAPASGAQSITPTMAIDLSTNAYTVMKVKPVNSTLTGFGSAAGTATSTNQAKWYPGYPAEFGETGAVQCENGLGARIERKQ